MENQETTWSFIGSHNRRLFIIIAIIFIIATVGFWIYSINAVSNLYLFVVPVLSLVALATSLYSKSILMTILSVISLTSPLWMLLIAGGFNTPAS